MITPVKEYISNGHPSDEDIQQCIDIANSQNCIIHLKWFIQYNGWNDRYIYPGSNLEETLDRLPKIYGI